MHDTIALVDLPLAELEKKYLKLVAEIGTFKDGDIDAVFCLSAIFEVATVIDDLRSQIGMGA